MNVPGLRQINAFASRRKHERIIGGDTLILDINTFGCLFSNSVP